MIFTGKGKHTANERFNILILSKTDARTKPVNLNIGKKVSIAVLSAIIFFIAALSGIIIFLIVRNAQDTQTISALGNQTKEQVTLIDQTMMELQMLYKSVFELAYYSKAENTKAPSPAPETKTDSKEMQEELELKTEFEGKIGDNFALASHAQLNNTPKVRYKSSNTRVAQVSKEGEVTLTGPGNAVITCAAGKEENTLFNITCESQFDSVHYLQSDLRWKFPIGIRKRACIASSFAIALENADIHATPRMVYNTSGLSLNFERLSKKFGIEFVNALSDTSPYFESFNGGITTIKEPAKNYIAAMKEALDRNPQGVCVYFKGRGAHMVVAVGYVGDDIYYSDPGRAASKGYLVKFPSTWVYYKHKMTYKHVAYFVAFEKQKQLQPNNHAIVTTAKER